MGTTTIRGEYRRGMTWAELERGPVVPRAMPKVDKVCVTCGRDMPGVSTQRMYCRAACRPKRPRSPNAWSLAAKGEDACRHCGGRARHLHHVVPRVLRPDLAADVEGNGVPLCSLCHSRFHAHALDLPRAVLSDREVEVMVAAMGEAWADRHYPVDP